MEKLWTPEEDEILRNNLDKTNSEIAKLVGRSHHAVVARKQRLGLSKKINPVKIGEIFGRLTVIGITQNVDNFGSKLMLCQCQCGNISSVRGAVLRNGGTVSCGCYNREASISRNRKKPGETGFNRLELTYKKGAKNRGISWILSHEEFMEIIQKDCFWCGISPSRWNPYLKEDGSPSRKVTQESINRSWISANGIDRINSDIGYELKNCVPCCSECNYAKSDKSAKDFFEHCKRVFNHISKIMK